MTDLAFWVAVYVALTVGAMAGMFIVAALHDCQRDTACRRRKPEPMRNVRIAQRPYDWAGDR